MKMFKRVHITANALALVLLTAFFVWTCLSLSDLPQKFGMHFGVDGNFDIYSENKVMAFYPFFAGYGLFLIFSLLSFAACKIKKVGGKHNESEAEEIRLEIRLLCDMLKLCWSVFWAFWAFYVIQQSQWHFIINRNITIVLPIAIPLFTVMAVDAVRKWKMKKQSQDE